jgi:short-subunit dehydrogenase
MAPVVVIAGGTSGIGLATAALFAGRGWKVGLIARGAAGLAAARQLMEQRQAPVATAIADVADSAALEAAAATIIERLGPIDIWINCAAVGVFGYLGQVPEASFRRVTEVTYHGTVNGTRIALAHMRARGGGGKIVNVCSAAAFHGLPLMASYAGAKAAVRAFSQAVQAELVGEGSRIKLCTIFPAAANTPFFVRAASYMGNPGRPLGVVYRPSVVAEGIWQAASSGRPETMVGGTALAFSLACRLAPRRIAWCMARLDVARQSSHDPSIRALHNSRLFVSDGAIFGIEAPCGPGGRRWSSQIWLTRQRNAAAAVLSRIWRRMVPLPDVPSLPIPTPPSPVPELGGLAAQPGAS